jgi:hypothetical protein
MPQWVREVLRNDEEPLMLQANWLTPVQEAEPPGWKMISLVGFSQNFEV